MFREGPFLVQISSLGSNGSIKIDKSGLEVENTGSTCETVRGNVKVRAGKWYYEIKLNTNGKIQIGWCTDKHQIQSNSNLEIGNHCETWLFDGSCCKILYNGQVIDERYGQYWKTGDIIGCLLDLEAKTMSFFLNGNDMGVAFTNIGVTDGLYPAANLHKKQKITFIFNKEIFRYNLTNIFPDVNALQFNISKNQHEELEKLFEKYKATNISLSDSTEREDIIKGDGLLQYGQDLGITDDKDPLLMIIAWKLGVNQGKCWEFTRETFIGGWSLLECSNIASMKKKCIQWREELKNPNNFKNFYNWVFDYLKEERKILAMEEAVTVWEMLSMYERWPLMPLWVSFLKEKRAVSRDTWKLFLTFTEQYPKTLSNYDADGCWPSMIDEFVEWTKKNQHT